VAEGAPERATGIMLVDDDSYISELRWMTGPLLEAEGAPATPARMETAPDDQPEGEASGWEASGVAIGWEASGATVAAGAAAAGAAAAGARAAEGWSAFPLHVVERLGEHEEEVQTWVVPRPGMPPRAVSPETIPPPMSGMGVRSLLAADPMPRPAGVRTVILERRAKRSAAGGDADTGGGAGHAAGPQRSPFSWTRATAALGGEEGRTLTITLGDIGRDRYPERVSERAARARRRRLMMTGAILVALAVVAAAALVVAMAG
jgi:hypothetical protein